MQKREGSNSLLGSGSTDIKTHIHSVVQDNVTIVDLDYKGFNEGYKKIVLPFIPRELSWDVESSFVGIKPMGRNNPKYHYTGSEDRLEFEIDWHSFDKNRDDVIKQCRNIEALSKGDAYNNPPHRVLLQWGNEDVLFKDMIFLVTSASYKLSQFNKSQLPKGGSLQTTALLPRQATQRVTLVRITGGNLSFDEIIKVNSTKYY